MLDILRFMHSLSQMPVNGFTPEDRERFGIPDNMIRLSCGIEDTADLIADLRQALDRT